MTFSLAGILVLVNVFGLGVEQQLTFSFRSQYDGYIYPLWIKKGKDNLYLSNDAVVVGEDFMVLCGGVEKTKGFSGLFSHSICLNIAAELEKCVPENIDHVFERVIEGINKSKLQLGLDGLKGDMRDVATTLVYMKLKDDKLFAGFVGNSGFSVFRYNQNTRIIEIVKKSKEDLESLFTSNSITAKTTLGPIDYEYNVKVGDILMVYSHGLNDVVPTSILIASLNFLVVKSIERKRQGLSLDKYDYEFDLAEFVEGYVQNLNGFDLTLNANLIQRYRSKVKQDKKKEKNNKFRSNKGQQLEQQNLQQENKKFKYRTIKRSKSSPSIFNAQDQFLQQDQDLNKKQDEVPMIQQPDNNKQAQKSAIQILKTRNQLKDDSSDGETEMENTLKEFFDNMNQFDPDGNIERTLNGILNSEYCNYLDPTKNMKSFDLFKSPESFKDFISYQKEKEKQKQKNAEELIKSFDCFRKKEIENKLIRKVEPKKLNCKDILDIIYPLYPTNKNYNSLSDCVLEVTPKLPDNITPEEISEALNSHNVERNIAFLIKYILNHPRVGIIYFGMKTIITLLDNNVKVNDKIVNNIRQRWLERQGDISIGVSAIRKDSIFNKSDPKIDEKKIINVTLEEHSNATTNLFKEYTNQEVTHNII